MPKQSTSSHGNPMHFSAGAVIKKNGAYLLIERTKIPFGFAGPAGHVDEGETPEQAVEREVLEETGLRVISKKLLFEEQVDGNPCSRGIDTHYWYVFECSVKGGVVRDKRETKSIGWFTSEQMENMELEPVWKYSFEKLGVLHQ